MTPYTTRQPFEGFPHNLLKTVLNQIESEINTCAQLLGTKDKIPASFITLPFNQTMISTINGQAQIKKTYNPDAIFLVGIGGSALGCQAVFNTLSGSWPNLLNRPALYVADTIDVDKIYAMFNIIEEYQNAHKTVMVVIVSKSGTTLETCVNAAFIIDKVKSLYPENYRDLISIVSCAQTPLHKQAETENFLFLEIPQEISGRFSLLTAAGLFPLSLLGIDITALCTGARRAIENFIRTGAALPENQAAQNCAYWYLLFQKGYINHNLFVFDETGEYLGKWYRQLIAESLGKKYDIHGNLVETGILPIVSIGTTDLHAMIPVLLHGPRNTLTHFLWIEPKEADLTAPTWESMEIPSLPINSIKKALFKSTEASFAAEKRPFLTTNLSKNAHDLGYFMQNAMCHIMLMGNLLQVNPFDQPAVELYKSEAKKLLNPGI
ncbi:MAG: hypothetical protein JW725_04870 [Candidatus Babeliaceae bacterium]|nr:hypothetical protein [Candidatus Babeliaceae bacterium]